MGGRVPPAGERKGGHTGERTIILFGRAIFAWLLIACLVVTAAVVTERRERTFTDALQRERDGTVALALAYASCTTASPALLGAAADRFGLSSDDEASVRLLLDAVIGRWPAGCSRLTAAMQHLRRAHGSNRAAYAERVAAIADEATAQTSLDAGAEDALHASQMTSTADANADATTAGVARNVSSYVRTANHDRSIRDLEARYRATIRATNDAASWAFRSMEQDFDR